MHLLARIKQSVLSTHVPPIENVNLGLGVYSRLALPECSVDGGFTDDLFICAHMSVEGDDDSLLHMMKNHLQLEFACSNQRQTTDIFRFSTHTVDSLLLRRNNHVI